MSSHAFKGSSIVSGFETLGPLHVSHQFHNKMFWGIFIKLFEKLPHIPSNLESHMHTSLGHMLRKDMRGH